MSTKEQQAILIANGYTFEDARGTTQSLARVTINKLVGCEVKGSVVRRQAFENAPEVKPLGLCLSGTAQYESG